MTHLFFATTTRIAIEHAVSEHLGTVWHAQDIRDLAEFSSHPSAILSDGRTDIFAKHCSGLNGEDQLIAELAGLRLLATHAGVKIPTPIGIVPVAGGAILLFEAVREIPRGPDEWHDIGRTLARIHQVQGAQFGLEHNGYFGPYFQDNRPLSTWPAFFAERRLWPRLSAAIDSNYLPMDMVRRIERIIVRLPELCGPAITPVLLHGDAHKNNFISTTDHAVVIDPAVFYGHPEYDLALIDYFEAVPESVFDGYRELLPIDPGFSERRALWRIPACLAVIQNAGTAYLPMLEAAIHPYE